MYYSRRASAWREKTRPYIDRQMSYWRNRPNTQPGSVLRHAVVKVVTCARRGARALPTIVGDLVFATIMLGVLRPIAAWLPYSRVLAVARAFGLANAMMPCYGRRTLVRMHRAFGKHMSANATTRVTAEYLARRLCDSVVIGRALRGRSDIDNWRVEQTTTASVDELKASDESFILATGHFSRHAYMSLYAREVIPQKITFLLLPPVTRTLHPSTWWLKYHYGQMLEYLRTFRPETEFVNPGQPSKYRQLIKKLSEPRNVFVAHVDARWGANKGGYYVRPFAGLEAQSFGIGVARLSRMSGRPIVVCIPYLKDDRTIVLDWIRVIRPSSTSNNDADRRVTDTILDDIERAVGRRPSQYVLDFLGQRRWDSPTERWV